MFEVFVQWLFAVGGEMSFRPEVQLVALRLSPNDAYEIEAIDNGAS
jgi:hypothetical protein